MKCLSEEQLARIALGLEPQHEWTAHVLECAACRNRLAEMEALGAQLSRAHQSFARDHDEARAQLLTALDAAERAPRWISFAHRIVNRMGGLTMRQKTILGSACAAAIFVVILIWGANATQPASAMERMSQNIRQAKSYQMTMDMQIKLPGKPGETRTSVAKQKFYWQAPRSLRMELKSDQPVSPGVQTEIYPAGKPGIEINHTRKQYRRKPARFGQLPPLLMLDALARYTGQADRKLGTKQIDGQSAHGFEIDAKKIDPDAYGGPVEIWLDEKTDLPVRIRYEIKASPSGTLTMRDFRWNAELDPKLFDTTPPAGYADLTPPAPSLEQQVREITDALATYAELAGHYPRVKTVYGDGVRDEMYKLLGIQGVPTPEQTRSEKYAKVVRAMKGFAGLSGGIFRENPDVAYYGLTVGPNDQEKVLLRWQLDDGRYQVIFGDLRTETVPAERLRELENRE